MIELNNISKSFNGKTLYDNFSLSINENQITSILGPSGIGKTTLVNMICKIVKADSGTISLPDDCKFSYVFQEPRLLEWYTVYENIDFVLKNKFDKIKRKEIIEKYLKLVGLYEYKDYHISQLSGGMAQRVSLARAFSYPSDILILDEPFKGLDSKLKDELMISFNNIYNEDRRTVLFITHDVDEALYLSDDILVLNNTPVKIVKHIKKDSITELTRQEIINSL